MLRECLDRVTELARQAAAPQVLESTDPRQRYVAVCGKVERYKLEPPVRNHRVDDLASLIDWARPVEGKPDSACPTVWHSREGVVCVLDDEDRRDVVTFPLTLTRAARAIADLESRDNERRAWQQRELIRFLRIDLGLPPALVAPWRKLDWDSSSKSLNVIEHGRDRMGRDVAAAVVGASDLPDAIAVPVQLYEQAGEQETYQIVLLVEIAALEQRIYLAPQPLALHNAILAHQHTIRSRLLAELGESARVYFGRP